MSSTKPNENTPCEAAQSGTRDSGCTRSSSLEEQARALLPTLSEPQRESVRAHDLSTMPGHWRGYQRTMDALCRRGVLARSCGGYGATSLTDLGHAVARLLASEVTRG